MDINIKDNNLRVLITGGAGFIGSHLTKQILDHTNSLVFNLDKLSYASDLTLIKSCEKYKNHNLIKANIADYSNCMNAIKLSDPDIIFHLAAETHVDRSIDDAKLFIESNIVGTFNILEIAKNHWLKLNKTRKQNFRFIHISTDEVFGSLGEIGSFNEKTSYDPRSPYSASKASSDHLANAWFHTYNFPVIKTNCSNNFGPFQFPEKLIPLVIQKCITKETIPIYGDGKNIRDWLFVEDHVNALLLIAKKGKVGQSYCIGAKNELTNYEIVSNICEIFDKKYLSNLSCKNLIKFVEDRPGHDKRYSIDPQKLMENLNWEPLFSFQKALEFTVDWYIHNQNWIKRIENKNFYKGERLGLNKKDIF